MRGKTNAYKTQGKIKQVVLKRDKQQPKAVFAVLQFHNQKHKILIHYFLHLIWKMLLSLTSSQILLLHRNKFDVTTNYLSPTLIPPYFLIPSKTCTFFLIKCFFGVMNKQAFAVIWHQTRPTMAIEINNRKLWIFCWCLRCHTSRFARDCDVRTTASPKWKEKLWAQFEYLFPWKRFSQK